MAAYQSRMCRGGQLTQRGRESRYQERCERLGPNGGMRRGIPSAKCTASRPRQPTLETDAQEHPFLAPLLTESQRARESRPRRPAAPGVPEAAMSLGAEAVVIAEGEAEMVARITVGYALLP